MLARYDFPGNIRELENMIERSVALETTNVILPESLALATFKRTEKKPGTPEAFDFEIPPAGLDLDALLADVERSYLAKALEMAGGVKQKAAELLGIKPDSFRYRFDKHGIGVLEKEE
jgi:two-component system response regulator PilR (NtrC family)